MHEVRSDSCAVSGDPVGSGSASRRGQSVRVLVTLEIGIYLPSSHVLDVPLGAALARAVDAVLMTGQEIGRHNALPPMARCWRSGPGSRC